MVGVKGKEEVGEGTVVERVEMVVERKVKVKARGVEEKV